MHVGKVRELVREALETDFQEEKEMLPGKIGFMISTKYTGKFISPFRPCWSKN
jgi:hypothetical protein